MAKKKSVFATFVQSERKASKSIDRGAKKMSRTLDQMSRKNWFKKKSR